MNPCSKPMKKVNGAANCSFKLQNPSFIELNLSLHPDFPFTSCKFFILESKNAQEIPNDNIDNPNHTLTSIIEVSKGTVVTNIVLLSNTGL